MDAARRGGAQRVVWTTGWLLLLPLLLCEGKRAAGRVEWGLPRKNSPQPFPESPVRKVDPSQRQAEFSYPAWAEGQCGRFYTEQATVREGPP